jgi:hypothetical protein
MTEEDDIKQILLMLTKQGLPLIAPDRLDEELVEHNQKVLNAPRPEAKNRRTRRRRAYLNPTGRLSLV